MIIPVFDKHTHCPYCKSELRQVIAICDSLDTVKYHTFDYKRKVFNIDYITDRTSEDEFPINPSIDWFKDKDIYLNLECNKPDHQFHIYIAECDNQNIDSMRFSCSIDDKPFCHLHYYETHINHCSTRLYYNQEGYSELSLDDFRYEDIELSDIVKFANRMEKLRILS